MITNAGRAGLTLGQLDAVVKANKDTLAQSGLGIAGATDLLTKSLQQGGDNLRKRLLNLGYTVEEQAGLMSEVMAQMHRSGKDIAKGPEGQQLIAQETAKYAENLRILSSITGEDARAKRKQLEQQNQDLAFQQVLACKIHHQKG